MYCERKEGCCQRSRNGSKSRADGIDEETWESLWREKDMQIEWRSLSTNGGLKPHVSAWGEDTATLRTHARNNDVTCTHQGHHTLVFQNLFLLPTFCCLQKPLACRLRCGLHLVRLAKQINKYSLLLQGHLPSWPVNRTILWKALPWQEAPWRNLCGQRSHGKNAAGKPGAQDAPECLVLQSTVCLPCCECFLLQIWIINEFENSSCLYSPLSKLVGSYFAFE